MRRRFAFILAFTWYVVVVIGLGGRSPYALADDDVYPSTPSVKLGPLAIELSIEQSTNAAGRDLRGSEFANLSLARAVFDRCDLASTRFVDCDLSHATFRDAVCSDTCLISCNIAQADFNGAIINGLSTIGQHLSAKQIQSTRSFREKILVNCTIGGSALEDPAIPQLKYDFRRFCLVGVHLLSADFRQCDFTDALVDGGNAAIGGLPGIEIGRARITFEQLKSTLSYKRRRLTNVTFSILGRHQLPDAGPIIAGKVDLSGMDLTGIRILGAALPEAVYTDARITGGSFSAGGITKAQLRSTWNYKEGNLVKSTFELIDLSDLDLSYHNMTGSTFRGCVLTGANFKDAVITDADFSIDNKGLTIEQIKSTWNYNNGRMAGIVLPKDIAEALQKEKDSEKDSKK